MPIIVIPGPPMAKPRGQRSDKWKQRPCMVRYWNFKDRARAAAEGKLAPLLESGTIQRLLIYVAFPATYSEKRRRVLRGCPHQDGVNDLDNFCKAIFDALFTNDGFIWKIGELEKRWEDEQGPRVELWL